MRIRALALLLAVTVLSICGCGRGSGAGGSTLNSVDNDMDGPIVFTTTGASFAPRLTVNEGAVVKWTWSDGATSSSPTPEKDFGSTDTRTHTLVVTPWSALTGINVGYGADDDGSPDISLVPQQDVAAVRGLAVVAPYLEVFCASRTSIPSLNFDNFINLRTVEIFRGALTHISLANTPALTRLNLEENPLTELDLSGSPNLADLRTAVNRFGPINWGSTGARLWHICTRDNMQMTDRTMYGTMNRWPVLQQLWIYNDNQEGTLNAAPRTLMSVRAYGNSYTAADFTGGFVNGTGGELLIYDNELTSLTLTGCTGLAYIDAHNNRLSVSAVDSVLQILDSLGTHGGTINLTRNSPPSAAGQVHVFSLRQKGWNVQVEQEMAGISFRIGRGLRAGKAG